MKLQLKERIAAKVAAHILLPLMGLLCIASVLGVFLMQDHGFYSGRQASLMDLEDFVRMDSYKAYEAYQNQNGLLYSRTEPLADGYAPERTNFSFEIWSLGGAGLGEATTLVYASPGVSDENVPILTYQTDQHEIRTFLNPQLPAHDKYKSLYAGLEMAVNGKWLLAVLIPITAVAALCLFGFLMASAGHRRGEGLVLRPEDRIPLDLQLAAVGFALFDLLFVSMQTGYYPEVGLAMIAVATVIVAAYGILIWTAICIARRVKHPGWWRNTLIYRIVVLLGRILRWSGRRGGRTLRWIWSHGTGAVRGLFGRIGGGLARIGRGFRQMTAQLPLIWKVMLTALGALGATALCWLLIGAYGGYGPEWLIFLVLWLAGAVFLLIVLSKICMELLALHKAGAALAAGEEINLEGYRLHGLFRAHGENLGKIGQGMGHALEAQLRSERMKTELITNVSHDIKTPLTSIINYVDLLGRTQDPEQQKQYIAVLDKHAKRLKKLTEDLLEVSKVTTGNVSVTLEPCDLRETVHQAMGEYGERFLEASLDPVVRMPEKMVAIRADGRHLWRVMDNLLSNVCKYSLPGTRVYVTLEGRDGAAVLSVKNVSREPLDVEPAELAERFVRGDQSRTTDGSGLGLSIAQSLTEVQGGQFALSIDGDLFKVELRFNLI